MSNVAKIEKPAQESQAMTVARDTPFEPTDMGQAIVLSERLAKSSLIPTPLRGKPEDVFLIIMTGAEIGLSSGQALRGMHVIEGRPVIGADLMVALCLKQRGICRYFDLVDSTATSCTYETHRVGSAQPVSITWTIEDAQRAGRIGGKNVNWNNYPAAMLRARCKSDLARAVYPDLLFGVYSEDEKEEIRATMEPAAAQVFTAPAEPVRQGASTVAVVESSPAPAAAAEPAPTKAPPSEETILAIEADIQQSTSHGELSKIPDRIKALGDEKAEAALKLAYRQRWKDIDGGKG